MKYLPLLALAALTACSTSQDRSSKSGKDTVTNESFRKERPLRANEVADFYTGNAKALSPALQDETIGRFTEKELSKLDQGKDPLLSIAVHCSQKDFKRAFAEAERAFDRYQKVAPYWNAVASCHLQQGSHRKALLFYNKALEVSPNYVPALNNIGVLYTRQKQDQKALVAFERASRHSKFSKTPRYNMAKLLLSYGIADQALVIFRSLLESSPQDLDLINSAASAHFILGDYKQAAALYARIPSALKERPEIGLNYAWTLKKLGESKAAEKIFESVEDPESPELKRYYSVVAGQLGVK